MLEIVKEEDCTKQGKRKSQYHEDPDKSRFDSESLRVRGRKRCFRCGTKEIYGFVKYVKDKKYIVTHYLCSECKSEVFVLDK